MIVALIIVSFLLLVTLTVLRTQRRAYSTLQATYFAELESSGKRAIDLKDKADVATGRYRGIQEELGQMSAELDRKSNDLTELLLVAGPLASKTSWSFEGLSNPHVRAQEVDRNNKAEALRKTIARISGATLREETLEEATGGKMMPKDLLRSIPVYDHEVDMPEGFREIGGTMPTAGEITKGSGHPDAPTDKTVDQETDQ